MTDLISGALAVLIGLVAFWFVIWLYILLPANMATTRGRSALGWVLISLFFSPFTAIIGLLVLGDTVEKALDRREEGA